MRSRLDMQAASTRSVIVAMMTLVFLLVPGSRVEHSRQSPK